MKKFKSPTKNKGTTIILEDSCEAIEITDRWIANDGLEHLSGGIDTNKLGWDTCKKALVHGDQHFSDLVQSVIDDLLGIVDDIQPLFAQQKQGYVRTSGEEAITTSADLLMQGEELCAFKQKHSTEKKVKYGAGEGAYRLLLNTDVSWWGSPEMNCGLVGAIILLLQRYAPVEIWIQQGWLGNHIEDGVTLFKLDYTTAMDVTSLSFWINHPYKDSVFSYLVNKALDRRHTGTSTIGEIECDMMLRGDWFHLHGINYSKLQNAVYTERIDLMAKWIAETGYKILYEEEPPEIQDI